MKSFSLKTLLLLFFVMLTATSIAQHKGPKGARQQEKKENIEAMKAAFITQKLNLTPEEAQTFWPVYNQYADKLKELRQKHRQDRKAAKENFDEMTDKEVEQVVDNEIVFRQKELDLQKEYHSKFKSILPVKKVAKLYAAEEQFKRVLLEKLRDKKDPGPGPGGQD